MRAARRSIPSLFEACATLLFAALALGVPPSPAQQPSAADRGLDSFAAQIAATAGAPASVTVNFKSLSSLAPAAAAACRRDLEAALQRHGLRLETPSSAGDAVDLTLSQNLEGVFWVADVRHNGARQVLFMSFPPGSPGYAVAASTSITLQRRDILAQQDPILDFLVLPNASDRPSQTIILEPHRALLYRQSGATWESGEAQPIPNSSAARDPRGEIAPVTEDATDSRLFIYTAGAVCGLSVNPHLQLSCAGNQDSVWPLGFPDGKFIGGYPVPGRNFFSSERPSSGEAHTDHNSLYFSAAFTSPNGQLTSLRAGLDGQALLSAGTQQPSRTFADWGSDIATISAPCTTDWHIVATARGDWTAPDTLSLYRISDGEAVPVGEALHFAGPILALWPSADLQSVRVVSRDLDTGRYEASIVTAICSH